MDVCLELLRGVVCSREYKELSAALTASAAPGRYKPVALSGLSEGAAAAVLPMLTADYIRDTGKSALLLFPDDRSAAIYREILSACGVSAMLYPARDYNFLNITASHEYEHERLRVLSALGAGETLAVCATASAALQITVSPDRLREGTRILSLGDTVDVTELSTVLVGGGYVRVDMVEGPGQFALRGGIIDIFSPGESPLRIELFGDEIDRMGSFDAETQRFTESLDRVRIAPAREIIPDETAREKILSAAKKHLAHLVKKGSKDAADVIRREISALENGDGGDFSDKYVSYIYPDSPSLMDHFDGLLAVVECSSCKRHFEATAELLRQSITDIIEREELPRVDQSAEFTATWAAVEEKQRTCNSLVTDSLTHYTSAVGAAFSMPSQSVPPYNGNAAQLTEDILGYVRGGFAIVVVCATDKEAENITAELVEAGITAVNCKDDDKPRLRALFSDPRRRPVAVVNGKWPAAFEMPSVRAALLDFSGEFHVRSATAAKRRKAAKLKNTEAIMSFQDLDKGDLVVHAAYGIGQYMGVENLTVGGVARDYVHIVYAGGDKLFLPVDQLDLVSKYIGAGSDTPGVKLSKMGGADWNRAKSRAKGAAKDIAKELIELYARRRRTKGIAFSPDDEINRQFAGAFEYEETDSQLSAIEDIRGDMEAGFPMDRIICGDVGYGKTEVALRAACKAVNGGYQVAILVPTTILAYQHYQTAVSRFRSFPVKVDMVSRFRTKKEQDAALRRLKRGETDIIIGTHRLISSDVEFYKLGLVIVDEEQRFGVAQKEKLKQLAPGADVLTLTATPIPRTLNMAMGGIIDMSVLDDVPGLRSPVQTYVMEHDPAVLIEAMRRELRRGGQVFYLHNRVEGVYRTASWINSAIPEARVAVAHGGLDHDELEKIWESLVRGETDILVSTTIIETGVDIPNANTLIIENADHFGLSQLHQIRGRVGRSSRRAYAYFTYPPYKNLSEVAEKRLRAIKEYAAFGAGFKIAMRDLEIRGAGNLLGAQQHGHMESVGYDMYIKLLEEAVLEEKGEKPAPPKECGVNLPVDAYIPETYISSMAQRMDMYKKIARIRTEEDYGDIVDEMCDRFGDMPSPVISLCRIALLRAGAMDSDIIKIDMREGEMLFTPKELDAGALTRLSNIMPGGSMRAVLTDPPSFSVKLKRGAGILDAAEEILKKYTQIKE